MTRSRWLRGASRALWPSAVVAGMAASAWQMYRQPDHAVTQAWCRALRYETDFEVANWSGTHSVVTKRYYQPQDVEELKAIIAHCHATKQKVRPAGMVLSPNGIAMSEDAMVSLASLDKILAVDREHQTITVQAGVKVSQVLDALRQYGLTLQNFSSIQDQQMGGWTQVAAHGTGASLPTVEEMIIRMKLVTPARGEIELSATQEPDLFQLAKVGLGCLGVVSEMTLRCIPQHQLLEHSYVTDIATIRKGHLKLLETYRHVRYMWLPNTGKVVVVISNPYDGKEMPTTPRSEPDPTLPMRMLLSETLGIPEAEVAGLSFAQLRDSLLEHNPLDPEHVKRVNKAERIFWELNSGHRLADSVDILGFECGGSQWVLEVAFPIKKPLDDIAFVEKALDIIAQENLPAPAPIEQRWTAASQAPMSPAHSPDPAQVFSWVGIIMYNTPGQDPHGLEGIAEQFKAYCKALDPVYRTYGAVPHWAKIEPADDAAALKSQRDQLRLRYDIGKFNTVRGILDPHNILGNALTNKLFDE
jgi:L-galactono-1,4-lactone dehydrogenase